MHPHLTAHITPCRRPGARILAAAPNTHPHLPIAIRQTRAMWQRRDLHCPLLERAAGGCAFSLATMVELGSQRVRWGAHAGDDVWRRNLLAGVGASRRSVITERARRCQCGASLWQGSAWSDLCRPEVEGGDKSLVEAGTVRG